ncbi:MAG: fumarylacetoacetate hydrolase family protein [Candidatus Thermoplasmatota archaeon]|jgi:2-keto-4-pentenoate hydratase/2-oxohepta-3-ene-1,7-dioic acid hydratase in catechol pathway|nr:fumarylacetoacetate hydrolase family protein [Candidatus Thermoplasmatota archaeon]
MRIGRGIYDGRPVYFIKGESGVEILHGSQEEIMGGNFSTDVTVSETSVEPRNPVVPGNIYCLARNYPEHSRESGSEASGFPAVFMKPTSSVSWSGMPIEIPWFSKMIDYETELVCIVGKSAHGVSRKEALDHVFGYTVGNDVSDRFHQFQSTLGYLAKAYPGYAPLGPYITTADEFDGLPDLRIRTMLNGKAMQDARTSEMGHDISEIIEYLSRYFLLLPGDVIFTGTPQGPGYFRKPPSFLRDGDILESEIERIGSLRNPVVTSEGKEA